MKILLNTLYVTLPDSYLSLDGETVTVLNGEDVVGKIPLRNIEDIVCFGYRGASPQLMGACAERGVGLCFLTPHGRFLARICGPVHGNVLLRSAQYRTASEENASVAVARQFLLGKIYNGRWTLERLKRDHGMRIDTESVNGAISQMKGAIESLKNTASRDETMGIEGQAAQAYFRVFNEMILKNREEFRFDGRNRRPPTDPVNAMLSFCYTLLGNEIAGALEAVGLDPAVGFLHTMRPGRYSLALDLLEELRSPLADRFVVSQINLGAVTGADFEKKENGAYYLKEDARKRFLAAWQKKKQETLIHPYLQEKMPWGLVGYAQAMLLSRWLRGDLDVYPPFLWK